MSLDDPSTASVFLPGTLEFTPDSLYKVTWPGQTRHFFEHRVNAMTWLALQKAKSPSFSDAAKLRAALVALEEHDRKVRQYR